MSWPSVCHTCTPYYYTLPLASFLFPQLVCVLLLAQRTLHPRTAFIHSLTLSPTCCVRLSFTTFTSLRQSTLTASLLRYPVKSYRHLIPTITLVKSFCSNRTTPSTHSFNAFAFHNPFHRIPSTPNRLQPSLSNRTNIEIANNVRQRSNCAHRAPPIDESRQRISRYPPTTPTTSRFGQQRSASRSRHCTGCTPRKRWSR